MRGADGPGRNGRAGAIVGQVTRLQMLLRPARPALLAALALVLVACGSPAARPHALAAPAQHAPLPDVEPVHRPHSRLDDLPLPFVVRPPSRMAIPSAGVDAAVEQIDFLDVPRDPRDVGWFRTGSAPGEPGTASFDGHLDWTTGPAVFWHLADVKPGDEIVISADDGRKQEWKVDLVESVPYTSTPPDWLYATQGPPRVSLITCSGSWVGSVYADRLLVRAVPAGG